MQRKKGYKGCVGIIFYNGGCCEGHGSSRYGNTARGARVVCAVREQQEGAKRRERGRHRGILVRGEVMARVMQGKFKGDPLAQMGCLWVQI